MYRTQTILAIGESHDPWWSEIEDLVCYPIKESEIDSVAEVYLGHIVKHYHDLPDRLIFLHSDAPRFCRNILDSIRFVSETCSFSNLGDQLSIGTCEARDRDFHRELFDGFPEATPPEFFATKTGSLFLTSRACIHRHPQQFYHRALELLKQSSGAPQCFERNWHRIFQSVNGRRGVVTATDKHLFRDLQFMILSLRAHDDIPVVVYDLGLSHDQIQWCLTQPNVTCRPLPPMSPSQSRYVGDHRWQAWLKPTYIQDAPFERFLWIDADCVVLAPLQEAFDLIDEGPLLLPEVVSGCGSNHSDLYTRHLPIRDAELRWKTDMNNGVIGLDRYRDRELLDAWLYIVQWAIENPSLRHLIRWYDQGALLWATLRTENETHIRACHRWNHPANASCPLMSRAVEQQSSLMGAIGEAHPGAAIVHWFGLIKMSIALNEEALHWFTSSETQRDADQS